MGNEHKNLSFQEELQSVGDDEDEDEDGDGDDDRRNLWRQQRIMLLRGFFQRTKIRAIQEKTQKNSEDLRDLPEKLCGEEDEQRNTATKIV
jgi:hypothetical protein